MNIKKSFLICLGLFLSSSFIHAKQIKVDAGSSNYNSAEVRANNTVDYTSSDLELHGKDGSTVQESFVRFEGISIPANAIINSAYMVFYGKEASSSASVITIRGEVGNSVAYPTSTAAATGQQIKGRPYTAISTVWNTSGVKIHQSYQSPDLTNMIMQMLSAGAFNGALAFRITGNQQGAFTMYSSGTAAYRPQLIINYTQYNSEGKPIPETQQIKLDVGSSNYNTGEVKSNNTVDWTSSDLELHGKDGSTIQETFVRFPSVEIPKNAVINSAYLVFFGNETSSSASVITIRGEAGNSTDYPTSTAASSGQQIKGRPYTTASAVWNTSGVKIHQSYQSPDLKSVVSEMLPDGAFNGNLAFRLTGNQQGAFTMYSSGTAAYRPQLIINYTLDTNIPALESDPAKITQLFINELAPQGSKDEKEDWIELYNGHDFPIMIKDGFYLSNKKGTLDLSELKNILIPAHGYAVLVADEKPEAGNLHLNFTLKNTGNTLFLSKKVNGAVVKTDEVTYPGLSFNETYGRASDGSITLTEFITSTYKAANAGGAQKRNIAFSHERGVYPSGFNLSITAPAGMTIRYTLDGKYPSSTAGTVYTAPISVNKTQTVKVYAYDNTGNSGVVAQTYILLNNYANETRVNTVEWQYKSNISASEYAQALASLPIVSASINEDLMPADYTQASFEYIDNHIYPDHENLFTNSLAKKFGSESINPQHFGSGNIKEVNHSVKFKFHRDAGVKKPEYPFFEPYPNDAYEMAKKFQTIELKEGQDGPSRNIFDLGFMRFSEKVVNNLQKDMGKYALETRYVHYFLDGKYRGVKTMRNDFKQQNFEEQFGDDGDNYTRIEFCDNNLLNTVFGTGLVEAGEGDVNIFNEIKAAATTKDLQRFKQKVNIVDLIKYQIIFMFLDCEQEATAILHNTAPEKYTKALFNLNDIDGAFYGARSSATDGSVTLNSNSYAGVVPNYKYKWGQSLSYEGPGKFFAKFAATKSNANAGNLEFRTLVKDCVLDAFGPTAGKAGNGRSDVPLSVKNVQDKIHEAVKELDLSYKLDAAYMAFANNVYTLWKNTQYPRIIAQVPERVSYSLAKWKEWNMAHTLDPVVINAEGEIAENSVITFTNPNSNTTVYYTLDGTDPMGNDGAVSSNAKTYAAAGLTLSAGSYKIVTRAFTANNWGPKTIQNLTVKSESAGNLIIAGIKQEVNDENIQFIILTNDGNTELDITGYKIEDAVTFAGFPAGTMLAAGESVLLVKNESWAADKFTDMQHFVWTKGNLAKKGEPITLLNADGEAVDFVEYGTNDGKSGWAVIDDTQYRKLKSLDLDNELAENWEASLIDIPVAMLRSAKEFTAIEQPVKPLQATVYPNPVSTVLNISLGNIEEVDITATIHSASGAILSKHALTNAENTINVFVLPRGIYYLQLTGKSGKLLKVIQFIKQ